MLLERHALRHALADRGHCRAVYALLCMHRLVLHPFDRIGVPAAAGSVLNPVGLLMGQKAPVRARPRPAGTQQGVLTSRGRPRVERAALVAELGGPPGRAGRRWSEVFLS